MGKLIVPSVLTISDVVSMSEHILGVTQHLTSCDLKIKDLHTRTCLIYNRLLKNQKHSINDSLTEELILLDNRRDRAFIALRDILHGISVSLEDGINDKAAKLYAILDKFGIHTYRLGYKAETTVLISLFSYLDLAGNQKLLGELGILHFYDSLKEAHKAFIKAGKQKSLVKPKLFNESDPVAHILEELLSVLTNLVALIQLNTQLNPELYESTYNQLVSYITGINAIARTRKKDSLNQNWMYTMHG